MNSETQAIEALMAASLSSECVIIPYDSPAAVSSTLIASVLGTRVKILDGVADQVEFNVAISALPSQEVNNAFDNC